MRCYRVMLLPLLTLLVTACAGGPVGPELQRVRFPEIKPPPPGAVGAEPHRVRIGDVVSIKFMKNPELNADATVRPDGNISLALVGEATAAGLTLAELRATLSERYRGFVARTGYGEVLKEGDELDLRLIYNPEYNQSRIIIRSDGRISLPLVGEIQAAGIRPGELREKLIDMYSKHLKNPDVALLVGPNSARKIFADESFISVTLSKPTDQAVFVGGEVLTPRAVRYGESLTTLQAIMEAGGVKETGDLSQVVVLRRGQFEESEWIRANLSDPLEGKSLQNDILLRNGDVVVVPRSAIAKVDLWVKQYIRELLPVQSNFNITVIPHDVGSIR